MADESPNMGLAKLVGSPTFQALEDAEKAQMIQVYKGADAAKQAEILKDFAPDESLLSKMSGWMQKAWRGEIPGQGQGFKSVLGNQLGAVANAVIPTTPRQTAALGVSQLVGGGMGQAAQRFAPGMQPLADIGGSFLSRQANKAIGTEDPGTMGDILSVAVPATLHAGMAAGRAYGRHSQAAEALSQYDEAANRYSEQVAAKARQREYFNNRVDQYGENLAAHQGTSSALQTVPQTMWKGSREPAQVAQQINRAYDRVQKAGDPRLPWANVRQTAREVMDELANKFADFQDHRVYRLAQQFHDLGVTPAQPGTPGTPATQGSIINPTTGQPVMNPGSPGTPGRPAQVQDPLFSEVRPQMGGGGLGGLVEQYRGEGQDYGLVKKLYAAVDQAMDQGGAANAALRAARALARRNFALQEVENLVTPNAKGSAIQSTAEGFLKVDPRKIYQQVSQWANDEFFVHSFGPNEFARLQTSLNNMARSTRPIANRPPPSIEQMSPQRQEALYRSPQFPEVTLPPMGLMGVMKGGAIGTSLGVLGGRLSGLPISETAPAGFAAGAAVPLVGRIIAQYMLTPRGQRILRSMMSPDFTLSPQAVATLAAGVRENLGVENPSGE